MEGRKWKGWKKEDGKDGRKKMERTKERKWKGWKKEDGKDERKNE